jgi:hypothetical protein
LNPAYHEHARGCCLPLEAEVTFADTLSNLISVGAAGLKGLGQFAEAANAIVAQAGPGLAWSK